MTAQGSDCNAGAARARLARRSEEVLTRAPALAHQRGSIQGVFLATVAPLLAIAVCHGQTLASAMARWLSFPLTAVLILPAIEIQFMQVRSPWEAIWPYLAFYGFGSGR